MTIKDKLNLMNEIKAANEQHVQDWKMKHWKVSYSVRNNETREIKEYDVMVKALNIVEALNVSAKVISEMPNPLPNSDIVIWNIGIMEDDVF